MPEQVVSEFNEDMIERDGLPKDVFGLIHDLCYHHDGRDVNNYVQRAQEILKTPSHQERVVTEKRELDEKIERLEKFTHTQRFLSLPKDEQNRLIEQFHVMRKYSYILGERIAAFVKR